VHTRHEVVTFRSLVYPFTRRSTLAPLLGHPASPCSRGASVQSGIVWVTVKASRDEQILVLLGRHTEVRDQSESKPVQQFQQKAPSSDNAGGNCVQLPDKNRGRTKSCFLRMPASIPPPNVQVEAAYGIGEVDNCPLFPLSYGHMARKKRQRITYGICLSPVFRYILPFSDKRFEQLSP
jgi:hypothetical protein